MSCPDTNIKLIGGNAWLNRETHIDSIMSEGSQWTETARWFSLFFSTRDEYLRRLDQHEDCRSKIYLFSVSCCLRARRLIACCAFVQRTSLTHFKLFVYFFCWVCASVPLSLSLSLYTVVSLVLVSKPTVSGKKKKTYATREQARQLSWLLVDSPTRWNLVFWKLVSSFTQANETFSPSTSSGFPVPSCN